MDAQVTSCNTPDCVFLKNVTYFFDILQSEEQPQRIPGSIECSFCDITGEDCSDRKEDSEQTDLIPGQEPELG